MISIKTPPLPLHHPRSVRAPSALWLSADWRGTPRPRFGSPRARTGAERASPRQSALSPRVRRVRAGPSGPRGAEFPVGYSEYGRLLQIELRRFPKFQKNSINNESGKNKWAEGCLCPILPITAHIRVHNKKI